MIKKGPLVLLDQANLDVQIAWMQQPWTSSLKSSQLDKKFCLVRNISQPISSSILPIKWCLFLQYHVPFSIIWMSIEILQLAKNIFKNIKI